LWKVTGLTVRFVTGAKKWGLRSSGSGCGGGST
jgi:hypothetical protein